MGTLNKYELLEMALKDADQIIQQLINRPAEYYPQEVSSLTEEYKWTVNSIVRIGNEILDKEPEDNYGDEVDKRIRVSNILNKYEEIQMQIDE